MKKMPEHLEMHFDLIVLFSGFSVRRVTFLMIIALLAPKV